MPRKHAAISSTKPNTTVSISIETGKSSLLARPRARASRAFFVYSYPRVLEPSHPRLAHVQHQLAGSYTILACDRILTPRRPSRGERGALGLLLLPYVGDIGGRILHGHLKSEDTKLRQLAHNKLRMSCHRSRGFLLQIYMLAPAT